MDLAPSAVLAQYFLGARLATLHGEHNRGLGAGAIATAFAVNAIAPVYEATPSAWARMLERPNPGGPLPDLPVDAVALRIPDRYVDHGCRWLLIADAERGARRLGVGPVLPPPDPRIWITGYAGAWTVGPLSYMASGGWERSFPDADPRSMEVYVAAHMFAALAAGELRAVRVPPRVCADGLSSAQLTIAASRAWFRVEVAA